MTLLYCFGFNGVTFYGLPGCGEEPLGEGRTEVQQQSAADQDDQEDPAIREIAVQEATNTLAELTAVQHATGSHSDNNVRAPVRRVRIQVTATGAPSSSSYRR